MWLLFNDLRESVAAWAIWLKGMLTAANQI